MKVSVSSKPRIAASIVIIGVCLMGAVIFFFLDRNTQKTTIQIKLHAVLTRPVAMKIVSPTATPTAVLKFYPTKGFIR